jgi:hypothetical protein
LHKACVLERSPLIGARRNQHDAAQMIARACHRGIEQNGALEPPLDEGGCNGEGGPGQEIAGDEPAGRGERRGLRLRLSADARTSGSSAPPRAPSCDIITVHIARTKVNSMSRHGDCAGIIIPMPAGIMRSPVMSMPPMPIATPYQLTDTGRAVFGMLLERGGLKLAEPSAERQPRALRSLPSVSVPSRRSMRRSPRKPSAARTAPPPLAGDDLAAAGPHSRAY